MTNHSEKSATGITIDYAEIERLIREVGSDDASMSPAPWMVDLGDAEIFSEPILAMYSVRTRAALSCGDPILTDLETPTVAMVPTDDYDACTARGARDAAGVSRLRNNAPSIATQLAACLAEIRTLRDGASNADPPIPPIPSLAARVSPPRRSRSAVTAAIAFVRREFRNDGAEGESVHLIADELEDALAIIDQLYESALDRQDW